MRRAKFQDVLFAVARKAGYTPESGNFFTNQAIPIGGYINQWVDRLYSAEDWPEWTKVIQLSPTPIGSTVPHLIPYENLGRNDVPRHLGRIIDVYLVDPSTTSAPVSTHFTLRDDGIHVGYEHGSSVWVKYMEPAPTFSAVAWRADNYYKKGDVVYVPATGECVKSKTNNNIGHDPSKVDAIPVELPKEIIQEWVPDNPGLPPTNKIIEVQLARADGISVSNPINNATFQCDVLDDSGATIASATKTVAVSTSLSAILDDLYADLTADPSLSSYTIIKNTVGLSISLEAATNFSVANALYKPTATTQEFQLVVRQMQSFSSGTAIVGQPLIYKLPFTQADLIIDGVYTLTFQDTTGENHFVTYEPSEFDAESQVLRGLMQAIADSEDDFFRTVSVSMGSSVSAPSLLFEIKKPVSLDLDAKQMANPYWEIVPFPAALVNPVIRGATADLLAEWGQNVTGASVEASVGQEVSGVRGDYETMPNAPLTTQERAYSRYRW